MNPDYLILYHENKLEITFFEFILLVLIEQREFDTLEDCWNDDYLDFERKIRKLEELGYIKWHGSKFDEFGLRKRGEDLFKKLQHKNSATTNKVSIWIDSWRNIFPEGVNEGGYRYRGNKLEVLKKMTKFVATYKYSREEIFEATKRYVERFSVKGYKYMQMAHFFIEKKDVGSNLASECENLKETKTEKTILYGGRVE